MKCPLCLLDSDVKNFKLINLKDFITSTEHQWKITSTFKIRKRLCPNCNESFQIGTPLLFKKVKKTSNPIPLTKITAKDAKILLKRRKKYFSIAEIQDILRIPIPIEAEKKIEMMALYNLFNIITYHNSSNIKNIKKYKLKNAAREIIYKSLGEELPEIAYHNKINEVNNLLKNLKSSYTKSQSMIIQYILYEQNNNKILFDKIDNIKIKPSMYNSKYEIIIRILINLLEIIENEKIFTRKEFMVKIGLETKELQKVNKSICGILENKLLYFNLLASKNQIYIEPVPIPREITEEIAKLEILLRKRIISSLKENFGNYQDVFLNGIPSRIQTKIGTFLKKKCENNLKKQLKSNYNIDKSTKNKKLLNLYQNSGVCSLDLLEQFMQQLDFNHLIILIYYHWQNIFKLLFNTLNLNDVILDLRIIKDARNTDAHRKYKLVEIAHLIESMFRINQKICS